MSTATDAKEIEPMSIERSAVHNIRAKAAEVRSAGQEHLASIFEANADLIERLIARVEELETGPSQEMLLAGKGAMPVEYEFVNMQTAGYTDQNGVDHPAGIRMVVVGLKKQKDRIDPLSVWEAMGRARAITKGDAG